MDTYWQRVTNPVVLFLQFVPFSLTVALLCDPFKKMCDISGKPLHRWVIFRRRSNFQRLNL